MAGNKGKYAEGKIRDILKETEEEQLRFTFNRIQDAHAAGRVFSSQAGDFEWFYDTGKLAGVIDSENHKVPVNWTRNGLIEVKEVEHLTRLPHKNFGPEKVARMRKRQLGGSEPLIAVCHGYGTETKPFWRLIPQLDVFMHREGGSWDLSAWPTYTLKELKPMLQLILLNK